MMISITMKPGRKKNTQKDQVFPVRFKELRIQKNLSQEDLGKMVGIHPNHLSRYERGLSKPSAQTLEKLADTFGVSSDYLISGTIADKAKNALSDKELLNIFQDLEKLKEEDQNFVKLVIKRLVKTFKYDELAMK